MRETLSKWIKGNIAETVIKIAANKVDMFKEGIRADKLMDDALGVSSERIQRGSLTILLMQFIKGLWAENTMALIAYYRQEAKTMEENLKKGK